MSRQRTGMLSIGLSAALLLIGGGELAAQSKEREKEGSKPAAESKASVSRLSVDREMAALAFAKENHPELAALLEQLKADSRKEYQAAVRDLDRTMERLERLRERMPDRHAAELEIWKVESRIRLLAARSAMGDREELKDELHKLILERHDLRLRQFEEDRTRVAARLDKLKESIASMKANREQNAEQELKRLLDSTRTRAAKVAPGKDPKKESKKEPKKEDQKEPVDDPEKKSGKSPDKAPTKSSEKSPAKTPEKTPAKVPDKSPEKDTSKPEKNSDKDSPKSID